MATRILAAACHACVIEGRGIGERGNAMARTAILIRRYVRCRFAGGDDAIVALGT